MIFSGQKLLSPQRSVCWYSVVPSQAVLVPPSYRNFVLDEFLINTVLEDKNIANMLLMFDLMSSLSSNVKKTRVFYCDNCCWTAGLQQQTLLSSLAYMKQLSQL